MEMAQREQSRWYHLSFWWFLATTIAVGILGEEIAFLEGWGIRFTDWAFFLVCGVAFLLCLSYCAFAHLHFKIKPTWLFLVLFLILALGNIVALSFFPEATDVYVKLSDGSSSLRGTYTLTAVSRARDIVYFSIACFYLYILWGVAPKCLRNSKSLLIIAYAAILLGVLLVAYSWATEWDQYMAYFDTSVSRDPVEPWIVSFAGNRNPFAAILLFDIAILGILQCRKHCWVNYLLMALFAFEEVLLFSKTCLTILPFYFLAFIIYRYVKTVRFHPVKSSIALGVFIVCVGALVTCWSVIASNDPNSFCAKITSLCKNRLFTEEHGTMDARYEIWRYALSYIDSPIRVLFGLGEGNMQWLLGATLDGQFAAIHNGFLLQFCTGGALRETVYLFLLGYAVFLYIRAFARRRNGTFPYLLAFLAALVHSASETTSFLEIDGKGLFLCVVLILPFLIERYQDNGVAASNKKDEFTEWEKAQKVRNPLSVGFSRGFIALSILPLIASLMVYLARANSWDVLFPIVGFGVTFAIAPAFHILTCCFEKKSFLRVCLPMCLSFALLFSASFAVAYFLPIAQLATSICQFLCFFLLCDVLLLALFRYHLDLPVLSRNWQKCEDRISARFPKWFAKSEEREMRYFAKTPRNV